MPRTEVNTDSIFGEDRISKFEDARMVEVYIKSIDGFEGDGTFVSNFGLQETIELINKNINNN